jgi:hypothetical protein
MHAVSFSHAPDHDAAQAKARAREIVDPIGRLASAGVILLALAAVLLALFIALAPRAAQAHPIESVAIAYSFDNAALAAFGAAAAMPDGSDMCGPEDEMLASLTGNPERIPDVPGWGESMASAAPAFDVPGVGEIRIELYTSDPAKPSGTWTLGYSVRGDGPDAPVPGFCITLIGMWGVPWSPAVAAPASLADFGLEIGEDGL